MTRSGDTRPALTPPREGGALHGRRALVTGAAAGIGEAIARRLAADGAAVALTGRASGIDRGKAIASELSTTGAVAEFFSLDVRDDAAIERVFDTAAQWAGGPIDIVVTAAGVAKHPDGPQASVMKLTEDGWSYVLGVNLTGTFAVVRAAAQRLIAAGRPGAFVTISSVAARRPSGGVYAVSKAGVWMMTRAFADELGPFGIRVNSVAPGYTRTKLLEDRARNTLGTDAPERLEEWFGEMARKAPLKRLGRPEDVADVTAFLVGEQSSFITGSQLYADGGYVAVNGGG